MFSKKCFCKENISKIVRPLLGAVSINGLSMLEDVNSKDLHYGMFSIIIF